MSDPAPTPAMPEGFVFLVTYGRSGSTMLQNVLDEIPGYLIRGENDNILYHMARAWMVARSSPEIVARREALKAGTRPDPRYGLQIDPWFGAENIQPGDLGRELAQVFTRCVLRPTPGTRVSGFKEIRFHHAGADLEAYLDFLLFCFPNSRILFNTRDLEAVAKSGWWVNYSREAFQAEVGTADRRFRDYARVHPRRTLLMQYDDYRGNPEAFRALFDFLGEEFDAQNVSGILRQQLDHLKR